MNSGDLHTKNGFWDRYLEPIIGLSPMDGVSDAAFRYITDKRGTPDILMTEFTPVEAIQHGAVKVMHAFSYHETVTPTVAQIYGTDLDGYYQATSVAAAMGFDGVDINMGCPDKSVNKRGAGAALIETPKLAQDIVRTVRRATEDWASGATLESAGVHPDIISYVADFLDRFGYSVERRLIPVSVKTRIGLEEPTTERWIQQLLDVEPVAISIHGRTLRQMYTGAADWNEIAKAVDVARGSGSKILGNGDVLSKNEAQEKIATTGVDGVLIGRGAFGNPWVFTGEKPSITDRLDAMMEQTYAFAKYTPEVPFVTLRKHLAWYCKGFEGAAAVRKACVTVSTVQDVERIVMNVRRTIDSGEVLVAENYGV